MDESRRRGKVTLQWAFPLALLVLVAVIAFAPGWVIGLIAVLVLGMLGYGGVAWYYRSYQQFHSPEDHR
jgi:CHASE2 domain-containing sensor protein